MSCPNNRMMYRNETARPDEESKTQNTWLQFFKNTMYFRKKVQSVHLSVSIEQYVLMPTVEKQAAVR